MFPTPKKLLSSKDIIGYTLPRLHTGKDWYVDFYVYDPTIDGLKRKKYMLNKPKSSLGLACIFIFRRVDFVWLLMSNSELLRTRNKQKTPYKRHKTTSSHKIIHFLMTVWGLWHARLCGSSVS